ncbi:hypothetical protein Avbf_17468, partial [Armadillidium vulgare]
MKFFFNKETKKCEMFSYGGCGKIKNYETKKECEHECENTES